MGTIHTCPSSEVRKGTDQPQIEFGAIFQPRRILRTSTYRQTRPTIQIVLESFGRRCFKQQTECQRPSLRSCHKQFSRLWKLRLESRERRNARSLVPRWNAWVSRGTNSRIDREETYLLQPMLHGSPSVQRASVNLHSHFRLAEHGHRVRLGKNSQHFKYKRIKVVQKVIQTLFPEV